MVINVKVRREMKKNDSIPFLIVASWDGIRSPLSFAFETTQIFHSEEDMIGSN